ncbi:putative copper export protein [Deinococcus metalli]|uniref:Putative copper export protein n=1 Tax=Deinococcus metalli TaxID=1141878 RepID=A0A7W8KDJ8_9DEIO|nr:CopD family protein [Deinococcus metalli]MBB5375763.1 putative copper export protein [Deinococcus metalli]GHF37238.1 hypothetical protein GCM10017781_12390 [Deinococcus metalli]
MTAILTALGYAGLTLLLGSALARRWLTPGRPGVGPGFAGLALLLLAWGGQVAVTLSTLGMTGMADVLDYVTTTATGRAMLTGLLGATLLLAVEVAAWPALLAAGMAGVTLWGVAGIGHGEGHGAWVRALHAVHAGAMTVWLGGVLALTTARRLPPDLARRFTPAALGSVITLAVTGLLMATEHLTALREWVDTPYGRALLLKLALVAAALLAAILVRHAFARQAWVRLALSREALVLAAVLGVTGVLSTTAPPGGHSEHAHGSASVTVSKSRSVPRCADPETRPHRGTDAPCVVLDLKPQDAAGTPLPAGERAPTGRL